jgi:hypothetical protein
MTCDERFRFRFFRLVEADLRLRHVPFDRRELETFISDVWPLVEPGDAPETWATAFLQAPAHWAGVG